MNILTQLIHAGQQPDPTTGAIIPPVYLTSTFVQDAPGEYKGYDYTRAGNPNFTNLETTLATLEDGEYATVFSSGSAALTALVSTLQSGDTVVAANDLYGGTYRLFDQVMNKFGLNLVQVDFSDETAVEEALSQPAVKMLTVESPTNPLLRITDIEKITAIARKYDVITVIDNTFVSPYFQQPLTLGADVVLHSTTKYIGGHSDIIGGAIITNREDIHQQMDFARKALGLNPSPFDTWLTSRGVKTLGLRMQQHAKNALAVAQYLESHPLVERVYYPGLPSHPQHDVAKRAMKGFGGVVSVEFKLDLETMKQLISSFQIFALAESLGGIESLVDHPASMTHGSIPREEREKQGLRDGLVRFSVGIEDTRDLLEDLEAALSRFAQQSVVSEYQEELETTTS